MARHVGGVAQHPFNADFEAAEQNAKQRIQETRRLQGDAQLQERNLQETRFGFKPRQVDCELLLVKASTLEDAFNFTGAALLYQRALAMEPEHHELRQYIGVLNRRINAEAAVRHQATRQQELSEHMAGQADKATLKLAAADREGPARRRAMQGPMLPSTPQEHGAALRQQAAEAALLRAAAKKRDAELDKKVVQLAAEAHAQALHRMVVGGSNDKLAFKAELRANSQAAQDERMRRFQMEMEGARHNAAHAPSGPLLGMGEIDAKRAAAELQRRTCNWHLQQQRLAQAGASDREAVYRSAVQRPTSAKQYGQQQRAPGLAPFSVDAQRPISANVVKQKQADWVARHQPKQLPVRLGQKHITLGGHVRAADPVADRLQNGNIH